MARILSAQAMLTGAGRAAVSSDSDSCCNRYRWVAARTKVSIEFDDIGAITVLSYKDNGF